LICRESARLVGTYHICATQSLNTRQIPNDSIVLCHLLRPQRQTRGDHSGQSFRNGSDGQRNRDLEVVNCALDSPVVSGVPKVPDVHKPDEDADDGDDFREHIAKVVQFAFQRCLFADLGGDRLMDVANGGALACENDYSFRVSVNDSGSLQ
jgi:hypothetical protein